MSSYSLRHAMSARTVVATASLILLTVLSAAPTAGAPAQPGSSTGTHTARGGICTIVGTPRSDRLIGTPGRDVICGRGGNDVLVGLAGDDLLDGGPGTDTLRGGPGADFLKGGDGRDRLEGGSEADRLLGGAGGDVALGSTGPDRLLGGEGNDDLTGGPQVDDIDGGAGTNWCTADDTDTSSECAYDLTAPNADQLSSSTDTVDVTAAERTVTIRVHVTDDTGVTSVVVQPGPDAPWFASGWADLTSGDARDGWWEATVPIHRWSRPGTYHPVVRLWDRVNHDAEYTPEDVSIEVLDNDPDYELPQAALLTPTPTQTFDVTTTGATIKIKAHLIDATSGVDPDSVSMVLWAPRVNGAQTRAYGASLHLVGGTLNDGTWSGLVDLPQDSVGGEWQIGLYVSDRASRDARTTRAIYWGPVEYGYQQWNSSEGDNRPFPDDMGTVNIIGREPTDFTAPTISGVQLTPGTVDTLSGPASITVTAHATDAGAGVEGLSVFLIRAEDYSGGPMYLMDSLVMAAGTRADGTWEGTITLPRGLAPGTYYAWVPTWDREDNEAQYIAPGHPMAEYNSHVLDTDATVTVADTQTSP